MVFSSDCCVRFKIQPSLWLKVTVHFSPLEIRTCKDTSGHCDHSVLPFSLKGAPMLLSVQRFHPLLFWRYDHKRCPSTRPPHQHLGVVGVRPSQSIGRNGLLVVEDVRLLLVRSTNKRGPGSEWHVRIHGDVDPHPPPHRLQHNALLQKTRRMYSVWQEYSFNNGNYDEVALCYLLHDCLS